MDYIIFSSILFQMDFSKHFLWIVKKIEYFTLFYWTDVFRKSTNWLLPEYYILGEPRVLWVNITVQNERSQKFIFDKQMLIYTD